MMELIFPHEKFAFVDSRLIGLESHHHRGVSVCKGIRISRTSANFLKVSCDLCENMAIITKVFTLQYSDSCKEASEVLQYATLKICLTYILCESHVTLSIPQPAVS